MNSKDGIRGELEEALNVVVYTLFEIALREKL